MVLTVPKLPNGVEPIDFYKNTDGMMPVYSAPSIPQTACRQAKNTNLFPIGGFSRRDGYTRNNTTAQVVGGIQTGIYDAAYSSGTHYFIGTCDTKIGHKTIGATSWTDDTGVLTITAGQNNLFSFAMLNDTVVCCNDVDTCLQVNSSQVAAVLAGSPAFTSALFPVEYRGYMFYGNTVETATRQPDRLRFSNNNSPNTFTATDFIDIAKKNSAQLRGAIVYRDRLLCFKENNIYEILFQPTRVASDGTAFPFIQNATPVVSGVGTQSHRTLCKFTTPSTHSDPGEYIFFVDQYGMPRIFPGAYSYGAGAFQTMKVGYPISMSRDTSIMTLANMNKSVSVLRSQFAVNYPERNQIWCFMSQTSQMDVVWILDYTTKWAWSYHVFDVAFTCAALAQHTDGTYRVFTGNRTGFIDRQDTGNLDNTTAIRWFYETGDVYKGSTSIRCNWPFFECRGTTPDQTQAIQVGFIPDGHDTQIATNSFTLSAPQPLWGSVIWGQFNWATTGTVNKTLDPKLDSKTLRVRFQDVDGSKGLIEGWTLAPKEEGVYFE